VGTEDRTMHPDLERFVAKRMDAKTMKLDSSHAPILSKTEAAPEVIRSAAKAVSARQG
jgi:hypothetical protein